MRTCKYIEKKPGYAQIEIKSNALKMSDMVAEKWQSQVSKECKAKQNY